MKTLLVISRHPGFAAAIGVGLDASEWRVRSGTSAAVGIEETGPAMIDGVVLDDPGADMTASVDRLVRAFSGVPVVVAVSDASAVDAALAAGATIGFTKPLRIGLLAEWLRRQARRDPGASAAPATVAPEAAVSSRPLAALEQIAGLSAVAERVLDSQALAREFLLHVRDLAGCNRAGIFLCDANEDSDALPCAFATGSLPAGALRLAGGIGGQLARTGRVLRRDEADAEAQREFADLGAEYAVPILDRRKLVGVALLDRRVTGEPFSADELILLFKAFEMLGLALTRARHHEAVAAAEALASGVFDTLETACVVVAADLSLAHVNPAARSRFGLSERAVLQDLPAPIVAKVFTALRDGVELPRFRFVSKEANGPVYEVSVKRVTVAREGGERAALLTIDDVTNRERERADELGAHQDRLVRSMAEHLAHEMGNTLVPLSTGQQLMAAGDVDAEMMKGLESVFGDSVRRIERLTGQMQLLSREGLRDLEEVVLGRLLSDALADASRRAKRSDAELVVRGEEALVVMAERGALGEALTEILLNALQSAAKSRIEVEVRPVEDMIEIDLRDSGPGFSGEALMRATEPFYSGRAVGMGLGLAVARRVVELHGGRLIAQPADGGRGGCVRLVMPRQPATETD